MASLNQVNLIGNVGKAPEIRYLPNGDAVANFSIATTDQWKDKQGQKQEKTEWHRIVCYRKLAEIVESYVQSGTSIYVGGQIESQKYTDKTGIERTVVQIRADSLRLLGGKPKDNDNKGVAENTPASQNNDAGFENMEDDIPF